MTRSLVILEDFSKLRSLTRIFSIEFRIITKKKKNSSIINIFFLLRLGSPVNRRNHIEIYVYGLTRRIPRTFGETIIESDELNRFERVQNEQITIFPSNFDRRTSGR